MAVLLSSYSEANQDEDADVQDLHPSDSALNSSVGNGGITVNKSAKITSCKFYLKKNGSPTGNAVAKLYTEASSVPDTLLATSGNFDVSTLTTSYALVTFTFSGSEQYTVHPGVEYYLVYENPGSGTIDINHYIKVGRDGSSPGSGGGDRFAGFADSSWSTATDRKYPIYLYGNPIGGKPMFFSGGVAVG